MITNHYYFWNSKFAVFCMKYMPFIFKAEANVFILEAKRYF